MPPATAPRSGIAAFVRRPAVLLVLALLLLAALMSVIGRLAAPPEARVRALTKEAGTEMFASFSPDGKSVAYSARSSGRSESFHVFVRGVAGGAARQVTSGAGNDIGPVWSPDGASLAFARIKDGRMRVLTIPAAGGSEHLVNEFSAAEGPLLPAVAWTKDGRSLVVSARGSRDAQVLWLAPVEGGGNAQAITNPPEGWDGDYLPVTSPDGMSLAFLRRGVGEGGDIWTSDAAGGTQRRVTFDEHQIRGLAWTADGREILFSSNRGQGWGLWRVPAAGGTPRDYLAAGRHAQYPAVARAGQLMAYSDSPGVTAIWRAEVADAANDRALIRPSGRASAPSYSPDGKRIAYLADQGAEEVWVAGSDGANPVKLTDFKRPRLGRPTWSPDGTKLAVDVRDANHVDVWTVPVAGGMPVQLTRMGASAPSWSRDGKWIYFGQRQVWRIAAAGGKPEQVTGRGGSYPVESVDGAWVYYHRGREIWRIPVAGGEEEMVYVPGHKLVWGALVPDRAGLYFMEWDFRARSATVLFYDFKEKAARNVVSISGADLDRGASFDISPDRKSVVYPKLDQTETNLMVVERFR